MMVDLRQTFFEHVSFLSQGLPQNLTLGKQVSQ
jgi:hypothetical protein